MHVAVSCMMVIVVVGMVVFARVVEVKVVLMLAALIPTASLVYTINTNNSIRLFKSA